MATWVMPASLTSSRKFPLPAIRRGSSRRFNAWPTIFRGFSTASRASLIHDLPRRCGTRREKKGGKSGKAARRPARGTPCRLAASPSRDSRLRRHLVGGVLDGFDDVLVAGAAAEVALKAVADFGFGRVRIVVEEGDRGHDHAGGAVAALEAVHLPEAFLDGVELA